MDSTLSKFKREAEIYGVRKYDLREPKMVEIATFEKYAELIVFECIDIAVRNGDVATALAIRELFLNSKTGVGKTSEHSDDV